MNKQVGRELKSLNIRDFFNSPAHRQAMGYFKHTAYKLDITQAELLKRLQSKSLEQINREYDYEKGNCMEIDTRELDNELKGKIALQQSSYEKEFRELNDKLLKVVESVLDKHYKMFDTEKCVSYCNCNIDKDIKDYNKHLLQEIRKAMENGN